jgi:phosphoribosylanthranilate isomerase
MSSLGYDFAGIHAINSLDASLLAPIRRLVEIIPSEDLAIEPVLLTKVTIVAQIVEALRYTGLRWLQLHRTWQVEELQVLLSKLRSQIEPSNVIMLIDPAHVPTRSILDRYLELTDFIILDHRQGGTGSLLDPAAVLKLLEVVPADRLFIAGGLDASNVATVIRSYLPYAVDAQSSLLDADGNHDPARLASFVASVRKSL